MPQAAQVSSQVLRVTDVLEAPNLRALDATMLVLAYWGGIAEFIEQLPDARKLSFGLRRKHSRTLSGLTAMGIALLLARRRATGGEPFSLNELSGSIENKNDPSRQRSARQSLIKKYKPAFEAYGLASFEEVGEAREQKYRIFATARLMEFIVGTYLPNVEKLGLGGLHEIRGVQS